MSKTLLLVALLCLLAFSMASKPTLQRNTKQSNGKTITTTTTNYNARTLYKTEVTCSPMSIRSEDTSRCVLQGLTRDGSRFKLSSADVSLTLSHGTTGPLQFNQHDGTVSFSVHAPLESVKLQVAEAHGAAAEILVATKPQSSNLYCEKNELKVNEDVVCHIESLRDGAKVLALAEDFKLANTDGLVTPLEQAQADHFTFRFMAPDALPRGQSTHSVELTDGFSKINIRVFDDSSSSSSTSSSSTSSEGSEDSVPSVISSMPNGVDNTADGVEVHFISDTDVMSLAAVSNGEFEHTFNYHDNQHKIYVAIAEDRLSASIMVSDRETVLESVKVNLEDMLNDANFNVSVSDDESIEACLVPHVLARLLALDVAVASESSYDQVAVKSVHLRKIIDVVVDPEQVDWSGVATPNENSESTSESSTPVAEPLSLPAGHRFGPELTVAHLDTLKNIFSTLGVSNRILAVQYEFYVLGDDKSSDATQQDKGRSAADIAGILNTQHDDSNSNFRQGEVCQHAISYLQLVTVPVSLDHCVETNTWEQTGLCSASIHASGETPNAATTSGSGLSTVGVVLVVVGVLLGAVLTVTGVRAYRQRRRAQAAEKLNAHNSRTQRLMEGSNNLNVAGSALGRDNAPAQYVPPQAPVNTHENDRSYIP